MLLRVKKDVVAILEIMWELKDKGRGIGRNFKIYGRVIHE
jgi:hypothetical protein